MINRNLFEIQKLILKCFRNLVLLRALGSCNFNISKLLYWAIVLWNLSCYSYDDNEQDSWDDNRVHAQLNKAKGFSSSSDQEMDDSQNYVEYKYDDTPSSQVEVQSSGRWLV